MQKDIEFVCSTGRKVKLFLIDRGMRTWINADWGKGGMPSAQEKAEVEREITNLVHGDIVTSYDAGIGVGGKARSLEAGRRFLKTGETPKT
jgi:hypothetical protein